MTYYIVFGVIVLVLILAYVAVFLFARKRQRAFDAQYVAAKTRYEVFVLNKKVVRERGQTRLTKFTKFKTYHVTGRIAVSQAVKGMQMSRMQNMTFHTTKPEFDKIQVNHKYKMDVAGNYIGFVLAPPPASGKTAKSKKQPAKVSKEVTAKAKSKKASK